MALADSDTPLFSVDQPCPCGRGEAYGACCGPLHSGAAAPTAERLMRSRYSAFALGKAQYLLDTWHSSTRPDDLELDPNWEWRRLVIEATTAGGPFDDEGTVTFTAIARTPEGRVSQREANRATDIARGVTDVRKVVRVFEIVSEEELRRSAPQPAPVTTDTKPAGG